MDGVSYTPQYTCDAAARVTRVTSPNGEQDITTYHPVNGVDRHDGDANGNQVLRHEGVARLEQYLTRDAAGILYKRPEWRLQPVTRHLRVMELTG